MMDNIARGLDGLLYEAEMSLSADASQAPVEVIAAARTRHRRAGSVLGVIAVVSCVGVGIAGVGFVNGSPEGSLAFTPTPSPTATEDLTVPLANATIPINGGPPYQSQTADVECGAPAPEPTGTVEHFGVAIAEPPPLTIATDALQTGQGAAVDTWTTYDSMVPLPVQQDPVTLLLIKDGKIAGRFISQVSQPYWTYNDFETFYGGASLMPIGPFCPEVSKAAFPDDDWRFLNPGEYQVMPMAHVWASEEAAALKYLYKKGIYVAENPTNEATAVYRPGSWDCEQAVTQNNVPRACLGDVTGTAIVDVQAGTVTLPYEPSQLTETLDVTVIGDPVALTVPEPFIEPDHLGYVSKPLTASDTIECGVTFDYTTPAPQVVATGKVPSSLGLGKGAFNAFNITLLASHKGTGEIDLEYGAKAWLVAGVTEDYNYFRERPGNQKIVGVADASIAGGNTVSYDRYDGPTIVDLVLSNVELCDGFDQDTGNIDSAILDGNISLTATGAPAAPHTHQLLDIQQLPSN
ncbi:hypothetical protein [Demequina aurantiaca]|uniref:hypothetical protein n=1 Tax=Demequina aurantiaca TaxID=676200 RepID=UPI000785A199|nr:hypothetical protein [Demequina aurantiaca]